MATSNILIVCFPGNDATSALAIEIAEGARAAGSEVRLRQTRARAAGEGESGASERSGSFAVTGTAFAHPTAEDAAWADAILFGTPKLFGSIPLDLNRYLDRLDGAHTTGALNGKFGGVFGAPDASAHGAHSTVLSLYDRLVALGLMIVPLGYTHLAPSAADVRSAPPLDGRSPSDDDRSVARRQGGRIAAITTRASAWQSAA